jgi:hypothetical protein
MRSYVRDLLASNLRGSFNGLRSVLPRSPLRPSHLAAAAIAPLSDKAGCAQFPVKRLGWHWLRMGFWRYTLDSAMPCSWHGSCPLIRGGDRRSGRP